MHRYDDDERLTLSAVWADEAHYWLARQIECGAVVGTTAESKAQLKTLRDGLMLLSDALNALVMPHPPPWISRQQDLH